MQFYRTVSENESLITVVEGEYSLIIQEHATYDDVGLIFNLKGAREQAQKCEVSKELRLMKPSQ